MNPNEKRHPLTELEKCVDADARIVGGFTDVCITNECECPHHFIRIPGSHEETCILCDKKIAKFDPTQGYSIPRWRTPS